MNHGGVVFLLPLSIQSLQTSPPYLPILVQRWKEPHGGTGNGLLIDLTKVPQGFAGHNLVGVDKAKPSCSHTPAFSEVRELLTLPNIDGDLTPLSAMLHVLTALILRTILDSEPLQGGMENFGKTLSVQAVAANPDSCHL
jgi:hypothetical protein